MQRMPVLFVGHGSPMNAIDNNRFTGGWEALGARIPRPAAILAVSAHWFTPGTRVSDVETPQTVYDMYGFPEALYRIVYGAPGSPHFAHEAKRRIARAAAIDNTWGIDHGAWSVLHRMYPAADIPVFQLSVDRQASTEEHYQVGKELRALRDAGVLIFGSGNIVHNLSKVNWNIDEGGYPWAEEFDGYIKRSILTGRHENAIHYHKAGAAADLAVPILDHYAPLLYVLGASYEEDAVSVFNEGRVMGSLSMTGYLLG